MIIDEPKPARLSLGFLRKPEKTKPRSPNFTGTVKLQRHTLEAIVKQFQETDADETECCLAGWRNTDANGQPYLSVELSPKYVARGQEPNNSDLADFILERGTLENIRTPTARLHNRFQVARGIAGKIDRHLQCA